MSSTTVRFYLGLLVVSVCVYFAVSGFTELARYGSCSSGGMYVSRRECGPGAGLQFAEVFLGLFGAIGGLVLAGSMRAVLAGFGLVAGAFAAYFFVTAFGADLTPGDHSVTPATAVAGVVCALLALPLLGASLSPVRTADRL